MTSDEWWKSGYLVVSFQLCHSWATPAHPQPEMIMPMFFVCHSHYKEFHVMWWTSPKTIPDASLKLFLHGSMTKCAQLWANHPSDPQRKLLNEEVKFDEMTYEPRETEFPHIHKHKQIHLDLYMDGSVYLDDIQWLATTWHLGRHISPVVAPGSIGVWQDLLNHFLVWQQACV